MDPLELLRGRNRFNVELPSGLWATIRLPRVEECMAAGGVPLPLVLRVRQELRAVAAKLSGSAEPEPAQGPEISQEERERVVVYQNELVRRSLCRLAETEAGLEEAPEIDATLEMVGELDESDWQQLMLWAGRDLPVPKAGGSTSTGSPGSSSVPPDASTPEPSGSGDAIPAGTSATT